MAPSLLVTAQDGTTRSYPLGPGRIGVGRNPNNHVVLDGVGVSSFHCELEVTAEGCILRERGSTNGTWLNGTRVVDPALLGEQDRFWVGPFLLQVSFAPPTEQRSGPIDLSSPRGPILRTSGPERRWRDTHDKIARYAEQWDRGHRTRRLLLGARELVEARKWLASPPPSVADEVGRLEREFIARSQAAARTRVVIRIGVGALALVAAGAAAVAMVRMWPRPKGDITEPTGDDTQAGAEAPPGRTQPPTRPPPPPQPNPDDPVADTEGPIRHVVIPTETLDDVAKRYGVGTNELLSWNLINPDVPLTEGQVLEVRKPRLRPLPQQRIEVQVERRETWKDVASRFGVSVLTLRGFNPDIQKLKAGTKLTVWVDPKPYRPREPRQPIPEFHIDKRAQSIGTPNNGRLENGILLPDSTNYFKISGAVWGSAYAISNLQTALANFRQDVDYEGLIIISDMSKRGGGHFDPHKSHQAGRDVDIWLPSVRGVYRAKETSAGGKKLHRPVGEEIDWYATWGLARALIRTGAVEAIFLDWSRQIYVYNAARNMGATPQELDEWLQYPRSKASSKGIFRHSAEHYTHIHVRFRCAEWERQCGGTWEPPGD